MTRYTHIFKRTYHNASGFHAPPSMPTKSEIRSLPAVGVLPNSTLATTTLQKLSVVPIADKHADYKSTVIFAEKTENRKRRINEEQEEFEHSRKKIVNSVENFALESEKGSDLLHHNRDTSRGKAGNNLRKDNRTLDNRTDRRSEKSREMQWKQQRQNSSSLSKICFHCREPGHAIKSCASLNTSLSSSTSTSLSISETSPSSYINTATGEPPQQFNITVCYICGSPQHRTKTCPVAHNASRDSDGNILYPFAQCFVCKQQGHLAGQCPQNARGIYPNGGECRYCQSVNHLARDCDLKKARNLNAASGLGVTTVGTMSVHQSADDDDLFSALHAIDKDQSQRKVLKPFVTKEPANTTVFKSLDTMKYGQSFNQNGILQQQQLTFIGGNIAKTKKKVVKF